MLSSVQHEAWISRDWEEEGMTWVVVARERAAGIVTIGAFLIDVWCLGVKDAYADEMTPAELEDLLDQQIPAADRETFAATDAKKLIEGAVAYAQSLGFLPHRDFRKARKVLNGIDVDPSARAATREFTFGCDGQPRFVIGPDDDDARVNRVIAVLTARLGEEGFVVEEYDDANGTDDAIDDDGVDWDALDALFRFVESERCPDRTLSGFVVSGFVVAAVMVNSARECYEWWRELFGSTDPELPDDDEFLPEEILDGFLELWSGAQRSCAAGEFSPSIPPLDEPDHFSAAADFCRGFLRVIDARPEIGARLAGEADASAALATLRRLATPPTERPVDAAGRRDAAPAIGEALRALHHALAVRRE